MPQYSQDELKNKISELFIVRASGHHCDNQRKYPAWELKNSQLKELLSEGVGGVILLGGTTFEIQERSKKLQEWACKSLLITADTEEGVGQRFEGATHLAPPMAIGRLYKKNPSKALKYAEEYGYCVASQAKKIGLNWLLAPVCDVNNNSLNPVINVRAWGENPEVVSKLIVAFHKGLSSQNILSCAKHFPGHGDTSIDSHIDLPILNYDLRRLNEVELVPFLEAIKCGVNSIMTGHLLFPYLDEKYPASLSYEITTKLLRQKIGYEGLIVTDAMIMQSIRKQYGEQNAALQAFLAGADLIVMPSNPYKTIRLFMQAFSSGQISSDRLEESLSRRRKAIKLISAPSKEFEQDKDAINPCEIENSRHKKFSIELIRNTLDVRNPGLLKLNKNCINLIRLDSLYSASNIGKIKVAFDFPEEFGCKSVVYHQTGISIWNKDKLNPLDLDLLGNRALFLQLFIRGNPFKSSITNDEPWAMAINQLQQLNLLSGLVVYGCPYLWDDLNKVLLPSIPAVFSPGQMPEAQKEVFSVLFHPKVKSRNLIINNFNLFTS